ncbi:TIGR00730 family Rossman fold protein [Campylobacter sp. MIT 99-7217]|uniref:LOG family protein n=1 Tax=Campylobacter sp. MIT 99-7217 TaxID=535091 RepID=UPI001157E15F|nr:TIGR00730 family Rossman fold protein [Campylobacter sp. MIT 99-7217]TQR29348.1 TIGR00730 family Rossman fold protein [Campylobacter sp. MIT 99-7217]
MKRIQTDIDKLQALKELENPITFFGSARLKQDNFYYSCAKMLAYKCVNAGFSVISGGGGGIMQAANEGALKAKEELNLKGVKSIGFNIHLPFEQKSNDFIEYSIVFESLAVRKMALIEKSLAFVIFPGGFGTLDELLEVLTLKQIGFRKSVPIFLFGKDFWQGLDDFIKTSLLDLEVISKGDEKHYCISDDLDFITQSLKEQLL